LVPELPNRPAGGTLKQDASNQRLSLRSPGAKLPLQIRSGSPPDVLVFEGSRP